VGWVVGRKSRTVKQRPNLFPRSPFRDDFRDFALNSPRAQRAFTHRGVREAQQTRPLQGDPLQPAPAPQVHQPTRALHRLRSQVPVVHSQQQTVRQQHCPRVAETALSQIVFVISEDPALDQKELPLVEALKQIVGRGMGAVLSCVPGRLAFVETVDERFILERHDPLEKTRIRPLRHRPQGRGQSCRAGSISGGRASFGVAKHHGLRCRPTERAASVVQRESGKANLLRT
jgi:hypothetical protein